MRDRMVLPVAVMTLAIAAGSGLVAANRQTPESAVTLSAVVVDRDGIPVRDLMPDEFQITENGKPVAVTDFSTVATGASATRGRSVVLVMGTVGTIPSLTSRTQEIARGFMDSAATNDRVSVVRMTNRARDEIAGGRQEMLMRIAEFRAPAGEPLHMKTNMDVLDLVTKLSGDLMDSDTPRRAIVFIGSPWVYDVFFPIQQQYELFWPNWVNALNAAARANVSVYVIDPNGLRGNIRLNPDGLVAQTGGTVLYNINDFDRAMERVWRDTSTYYALAYVPETSRKELQNIKVTVTRPGVKVHARRSR
jgi:VWFA-related protein